MSQTSSPTLSLLQISMASDFDIQLVSYSYITFFSVAIFTGGRLANM